MNCNEIINSHHCRNCHRILITEITENSEFCDKICYNEYRRKTKRPPRCLPSYVGNNELKSGTVGAISELIVSVDLMQKGYHVFRAISPSCPCDLLILNNGDLKRIEVRTARMGKKSDKIYYPINKKDFNKFDIMALVVNRDLILYKTHDELENNGKLISVISLESSK